MAIIVKPNIKVPNIKIEMDPKADYAAKRIIYEMGRNIPIIQIGDYVLGFGELIDFSLKVSLNNLPTFRFSVNDDQYIIREKLKSDIDKCIIFIGFEDWYIRFQGILDKSYSDYGDSKINLMGILYNDKLYNGTQFSFKDKTIQDILKDVCTKTSMGLFTISNNELTKQLDYSIMTGTRYIDYIDSLIKNYTDNIYSIDPNYFIHVGNIENLRKQPLDKYSINWSTGKKLKSEVEIKFKSIIRDENSTDDQKIPIKFFTINTNFSEIYRETYSKYLLGYGGNKSEEIKSNNKIGIGSNQTNTFLGFKKHKFPFYEDRINKQIGGNLIKIFTENILFELTPFTIVDVELYLPFRMGEKIRLDTDHSGKKIVIGYEISYKRSNTKELNTLTQTIDLI